MEKKIDTGASNRRPSFADINRLIDNAVAERTPDLKLLLDEPNSVSKISIGKLPWLKRLDLSNNFLTSLPPEIIYLEKLEELVLSNNQFDYFPLVISQLNSLRLVNLNHNWLSSLPPRIEKLPNLETILLSGNRLRNLPTQIGNLSNLKTLDLSNNNLTDLPDTIIKLRNLNRLDLHENQLSIPLEILAKIERPYAIFAYLFGKTRKPLHEAKALFVGQGSVGKTSLIQQILHGSFNQNQSKTDGISINQWQVGGSENRKPLFGAWKKN